MKAIITLVAFVGAIFISQVNAQTVSGNVLDEEGIPIPGVNVVINNTTKGAVTDFDGLIIFSIVIIVFIFENVDINRYF
jgi:hypothetical protein